MKTVIITLLLYVVAPVTFIGMTIKNSKGCNQIVIDTYEIHSGINIPKVEYINCYFDDEQNVRMSIYSFKDPISLNSYLYDYKFEPINSTEIIMPIALSENEKPMEENLYAISGTKWGREWRYIVEKESSRLWAEIKYN